MATGSIARRPHTKQIAYLEPITILFNTTGIATGVSMGWLPRGAMAFVYHKNTGFSAAGTRVLTVGTNSSSFNNLVSTITEETASEGVHLLGFSVSLTVDSEVIVKMTTTGTAATTGRCTFLVAFIPPAEVT